MTAYPCRAADAKLLPLTSLCADEPADKQKVASIAARMQRGDFFDPIIVGVEGGRYRVLDGKHRTRAARALGHSDIPVVISC
jgi:ParB-like chromosome segregation protein Spo0J